MTQFETIMFLKSPTPSVPIFIAAEVEISVQPVISMFSHGPYSELPFEVLRQMQSSAHSTWQSQIRTLLQWSGSMPSEFATSSEPIVITAFDRDENTRAGHIKNISYRNITCVGENGVMICGTAENKIENVVFSDVDVTLSKTSKWDCGLYDMRPGLNKEVEKHKNAGFYLRFADNVTLRNTSVKWGNVCPEYSAALEALTSPLEYSAETYVSNFVSYLSVNESVPSSVFCGR